MILLPEKYNDIELNTDEKLLINMIKNKFNDDVVMLLKINPVSQYSINAIIFEDGICFIENISINDETLISMILQGIKVSYKENIKKITNKLLMHRMFNDIPTNLLKFKFTYKYYLPKLKILDVNIEALPSEIKTFVKENCIFKDQFMQLIKEPRLLHKEFLNSKEQLFSNNAISLKGEALDILVHMIAPEYTIPTYQNAISAISKEIKKEEKEYHLAQGDLSVKVLRLDTQQINIINSMKSGNQLILACAGSGKSVLLISKCFKIASINPKKDFLITCYNKNLNDMYKWRINIAGFRNRNVDCYTFHKLCINLLDDAGLDYNGSDFDSVFEVARKALKENKIKKRYYGIFIDEVQVFKSEWYEFCYDLLEKQAEDDYFFVICGDKSQRITKNIKQGKAPWQGNERLPNYRGKSLRLEKNYRSTIEINSYINKFTEIAKDNATQLNVKLKEDEESFLRGRSVRQGCKPELKIINRKNEVEEIISSILFLDKEQNIPLSEIAVLMFNKQYKPEKYFPYYNLTKVLDNKYIDFSELVSTEAMNRTTYGDREGITLSTIESALGLDFQAVIICGLQSMGSYYKTKKQGTFNKDNPQFEECKEDFIKNINTLYTGCTRARDNLIVILTENQDKSIYSKMLIEALIE